MVPSQSDDKLLHTLVAAAASSAASATSSLSAAAASSASSQPPKPLFVSASSSRSPFVSSTRGVHGVLRSWDGVASGLVDAAEALQLHIGSSVPPCPEVFRFLARNYAIVSPSLVEAAAVNSTAAAEAGIPLISALWHLMSCIFTKEQYVHPPPALVLVTI
jgi:hypothetical protein